MCSSGTTALYALVSLHTHLYNISEWLISSFGFPCSHQNILANAIVVDCDKNGFLEPTDRPAIATNVFGGRQTMDARIVDSAMAFDSAKHGANEIISFHHTKPWGFGEGGCAIIRKDHEKIIRSIINFGLIDNTPIDNKLVTNAKMSDIAAAFILDRLDTFNTNIYREQFTRIVKLAAEYGIECLNNSAGTPCNVPLMFPRTISKIKNQHIVLHKYYKPLQETPNAADIYRRIVNFPCHTGIAQISDKTIKGCLEQIIKQNYSFII